MDRYFIRILITYFAASYLAKTFLSNQVMPFILLAGLCFFVFVNLSLEKTIIFMAAYVPLNNAVIMNVGFGDMRLSQIMWMLIVSVLLLRLSDRGFRIGEFVAFREYDSFLGLFCVLSLMEAVFAEYPVVAVRETVQFLYFCSLFWVLRRVLLREKSLDLFLRFNYWISIIFVSHGMLNALLGHSVINSLHINVLSKSFRFMKSLPKFQETLGGISIARIDSFFWGSVGTANVLIILYFISYIRKFKFSALLRFLIIVVLMLTGSRAGYVIFYLLFLWESFVSRRNFQMRLLGSLFIIFCGIGFMPLFSERIMEVLSGKETSTMDHLSIWQAGWDMFARNPFLGVGAGNFALLLPTYAHFRANGPKGLQTESHNIILKIISENGIFGLLLLGAFFYVIFSRILSSGILRRDITARMSFFAFLGTFLMNLTMNAFMIEIFWVTLALMASRIHFKPSDNQAVAGARHENISHK